MTALFPRGVPGGGGGCCAQPWSLLAVVTLGLLVPGIGCADVTYTVPEEQAAGSVVGSLPRDTDLAQYVSADSLPNLRYSFLAGDSKHSALFALDELTGQLSTWRTGRIDRESVCPFAATCLLSLQVAVQSTLNQFFKKIAVDVNITDINDNAPTFSQPSTQVVISESVGIPSSFPLVSALDLDTGTGNGLRDYELLASTGPFALRQEPGSASLMLVVERAGLDHERQDAYHLTVVARDGGSPSRSGTLLVNITVGDENDNEPRFTEPAYSVTVDEDAAPGSALLVLTATDRDSGANGHVRYALSLQQAAAVLAMFAVHPDTGHLTVAGDLQSADADSYSIVVEAADQGSPPFSTATTVTVSVRDTINSPPRLTVSLLTRGKGYSSISEYANLGAVVAHIAVRDADRGRNGIVQCALDPHPYFDLQGFDVNEYKVIVARSLDRETVAAHNVTVRCRDAGLTPLTAAATFEVRVEDENDNSPRFLQARYLLSLPENSVPGRSVLTVLATDGDADDNGRVRYSLQPDARGRFIISPDTGVILTHDDFDYELETTFNFTVTAADGGNPPTSGTARVLVTITDVNDQRPSFARDVFPFTVSELAMPGKLVGRVTANDFERGPNGQVRLLPDPLSAGTVPFAVLPNGSIVLTGALDHEADTFYRFNVLAVDRGRPPLNDTAEVRVTVLDENDNRPYVTHPNGTDLHLFVSMDDDIAKPLAMIKARDPDSGLNGQVQFIITSRNDSGRFDVDSNSGEVFVTRALTLADVSTYRVQVLVQDSGTPPLPADRTITLWVHAGNGTRAADTGRAADQYVLITLAIVCVTVILSAIIVLVIVLMRRMDRRRKPPAIGLHAGGQRALGSYSAGGKADRLDDEGMGDLGKAYHGDFHTFGKGQEDEDFGFSTFGCSSDGDYGKSVPLAEDSKSAPEDDNGTPVHPPVSASLDGNGDMDSVQMHPMLLHANHHHTAEHAWHPVVQQEDGQSESSEETIPSDSGRGGSEEELSHSHGAGLSDALRLAALHDAHLMSLGPTPGRSSVRDPVRGSHRKHVTFKDLTASRRGARPAGVPRLQLAQSHTSSPVEPRPGDDKPHGSVSDSPRYCQFPNRDSPRQLLQTFAPTDSAGGINSTRRGPNVIPDMYDSTRFRAPMNVAGKTGFLESQRSAHSVDESSRNVPVYVNEPFCHMEAVVPSPGRYQASSLFHPDDGGSDCGVARGLQELRPCGSSMRTTSREHLSGPFARELGGDGSNDNATAADDCDDQRSTTTSGSYTIDTDNYLSLEMKHSPWKDVVV